MHTHYNWEIKLFLLMFKTKYKLIWMCFRLLPFLYDSLGRVSFVILRKKKNLFWPMQIKWPLDSLLYTLKWVNSSEKYKLQSWFDLNQVICLCKREQSQLSLYYVNESYVKVAKCVWPYRNVYKVGICQKVRCILSMYNICR